MNDPWVPVFRVSPRIASVAVQKDSAPLNRCYASSVPFAVFSLLAFSASARAQSAAETSSPPDDGAKLEEVVVTAEKRGESIQNVPISMTALTGDSLRDAGVTNATELASQVPSLAIGNNGDSIEIFVRGIGSTNDTEVGDPAVAFNVDGVYIGRPSGAGGTFFDVNRIEVLRGPQGTLYGRNATAGAVNVITMTRRRDSRPAVT
jgi:iron complex outermembrane receptor protein